MAESKKKATNKKPAKKNTLVIPRNENKCGFIEYHMSKECADDTLAARTNEEKKIDPQLYLCQFVDEEYGLLGQCIKVVVGK